MAEETWVVSSNWRFSADVNCGENALPVAQADVQHNPAGFTIYNDVGSGTVLTLRRLSVRDRTNQEVSTYPVFTHNYLYVTNSANEPTVTGDPITPIKMDTNAADMSSSVKCGRLTHWTSLPALSQANPQMTRKILLFPNLRRDLSVPLFDRSIANLHASVIAGRWGTSTTDPQPVRLQAGSQFSLMLGQAWSLPKAWQVSILVRVGTDVYLYRAAVVWGEDIVASQSIQGITIWNATGSAVVPEILDVKLTEVDPDTNATGAPDQWSRPALSLETISYHVGDQVALTPVALDTTNAALPSGIRIRAGGVAVQTSDDCMIGRTPRGDRAVRRTVMPAQGISAANFGGTAGIRMTNGPSESHVLYASRGQDAGLTIRPGEGISLMQRGLMSGVGNWDVDAEFSVVVTPADEAGYSRGRVVNP